MKHILFVLIGLSIISCANDSDTFTLKGNAIGFADGTKIFVNTITNNNQTKVIDTLLVKSEKFSATYPKSDALAINFLQAENVRGNVLFFPENTNLKATIYKDSIASSFVSGGKQNNSYQEYVAKLKDFSKKRNINSERFKQARRDQNTDLANQIQEENNDLVDQERGYKIVFVSEHPNSLFSVLLLTEMLSRKELTAADSKTIAAKFSPKIAATSSAKALNKMIISTKKAIIGGQAPNFMALTPESKELALKDVLGKYTIIDFWASWCKPCRRENPNVVRVYNKYHEKGLNIISVSLDKAGQKDRWIQAIEKDQMDWHHVSNLKGWSDPIAQQYNVRSIPATFLLDENGVIIAKNLRGNALDEKIASLFGE